ncbi:MAG: hypothetical protein HWD59_05995 [Coxiellaceae bacterium]|nr:MAG: hypothetical protein HWD59_05995 [Coxiellaceae bacterium]
MKNQRKKAKLPITPSAAADIVDNFFKQTQEIQNIILRVKSGDYQVLETIISPEVIEKVLAEIKISNLSAQLQSSLFGIISKLAHRRLNLLVFSKIDISDDELEVVLKIRRTLNH